MSRAVVAAQFLRNKSGKQINVRIGGKAKPQHAGNRIVPLATIRCREIDRYILDRYGPVLPDDDAARDDVMIMLHHIAYKQTADRQWLMDDWLDRRAPWLIGEERIAFVRKVFRHPIRYSADTLAEKLGLTWARRQRLAITTIGAIDMPAEARKALRAEKDRERKRKARQAKGRKPRSESVQKLQPWLADGVSRSTWFRRQAQAKSHYAADTPVSRICSGKITIQIAGP